MAIFNSKLLVCHRISLEARRPGWAGCGWLATSESPLDVTTCWLVERIKGLRHSLSSPEIAWNYEHRGNFKML